MPDLDVMAVYKASQRFLMRGKPSEFNPALVLKALAESVDAKERPDFFGDGGPVADIEKQVAELLGKPAALFLLTGTMAQQIALRIWTDRRACKNIVLHPMSHPEKHEDKAYERLHGLHAIVTGTPDNPNALIRRATVEAIAEPIGAVLVELPQRWLGGVLLPWEDLADLSAWARQKSVPLHLDGARLWECKPYYQRDYAEIAALFDTVYVSFYKGLGALAGAALAGSADFIAEARVWRKRHGGAPFQMYPYAVSARQALTTRLSRMQSYHEMAVAIARQLAGIEGIELTPDPPHTNMLHAYLKAPAQRLQAAALEVAHETGVWLFRHLYSSPLPAYSMLELTVSDDTLELTSAEIGELFASVLQKARAAS